MNRFIQFFFGALMIALLCSSCGREEPPEASSAPPPSVSDVSEPAASSVPEPDASQLPESPDPEERFMSHPIPLELPEGEVPEGTIVPYTRDYSVTVDNGRQLTLRLRCEAERQDYDAWYYGVRFIDVLEEGSDRYLDRLSIHAADAVSQYQAGSDIDWATEKTWQWNEDDWLTVEDLNFDGIPDLRLAAYTGVVNTNYLCWLWEPENQRFEYAFSLHGYDVRIDPEKQQIITEDRDASTYTTKTYQYNKDGRLYLADSSAVTY